MLSTIAFAVNSAMKGFASLMTALDPSMSVDLSGSTVRINGLQLGVEFSNDALTFFLGRTISLIDIFGSPKIETLGIPREVVPPVNMALMIDFIQAMVVASIISTYISSPIPITEATKWMLLTLVAGGLVEWFIVTPDHHEPYPTESINHSRVMGLTAEFFAAFHFGWAIQLLLNALIFLLGHITGKNAKLIPMMISLQNFFVDIIKEFLYIRLFDVFVNNPFPIDRYYLIDNPVVQSLRVGMLIGEIEGIFAGMFEMKQGTLLEELNDFVGSFFMGLDVKGMIDFTEISSNRYSATGTLLLTLLSFAYHLFITILYLKRVDQYL